VTGGLAFLTAVVAAVLSLRGQHQRDQQLADTNGRLELLKDRLNREAAEESARRAYQYEARQRLYTEIQPLLFQLSELCESSYDRIVALQQPRVFRRLETPSSYVMLSTIHRLVSPLVVIRQIQRRLTAVDLGVDSTVRGQYLVAKEIARTLTFGEQLAETEPKLSYIWKTYSEQQHIGVGELELLVTLLTVRDADGATRWMDYSELQAKYHDDEKARLIIDQIQMRLLGANPLTKPVVWRTLVAEAYLQWAMIRMVEGELSKPESWEPPDATSKFYWETHAHVPLPSGADAKSTRTAVLAYVGTQLNNRLDSNKQAGGH
jgi:hypothetical protein